MMSVGKKLSIAFYWHMHQPVYQLNTGSDFLMPWVRLHAVKDYLDMALMVNKYDNLKLNFNIVPVLLNSLIRYDEDDLHDIHSRLTITEISKLTDDDKLFILNNFFDANYSSMIYHHEPYSKLYQKRFVEEKGNIEDYCDQEYSDIMAWFNLAWLDPIYKNIFPELKKFLKKGQNFTLEDRIEIIGIHKKIIHMIIPTYKELIEKNKIEITTSPYYHPILPILLDVKSCQKSLANIDNTIADMDFQEDAKIQVQRALDRMEELFGVRPKGMWPSEHCISPQELELFKELGIEWTISDEGILSSAIDFEFVRDFRGYLEDPYHLLKSYEYKTKNSNIKIIFRDSVIPNLIGFEYANHNPKVAAADLYDRIKVIQNKLQSSPDENHLLTIAMDGENCWENYYDDGATFLKEIYTMIEEDTTLETVLISEYLEKEKKSKLLKKVPSGSWINKSFQLWIGEPVKNLAWSYVKKAKEDLDNFIKENPDNENIHIAHRELLVAQGSDWFWWYGEPNDSGQDHIFDFLFREHLKNLYKYTGMDIPEYLNTPLISVFTKPSRYPKSEITPAIDGKEDNIEDEWLNAGCINMPDGPVLQEGKLFDKICYGADSDNFYLRLYLSSYYQEKQSNNISLDEMYIYMRNASRKQSISPVRLINKTETVFPIIKEKFHNELRALIIDNKLYPLRLSKSMQGGLWSTESTKDIAIAFEKVVDIKIPFDLVDILSGEELEFFFASAHFGIKDAFIPQDVLLNIKRQ